MTKNNNQIFSEEILDNFTHWKLRMIEKYGIFATANDLSSDAHPDFKLSYHKLHEKIQSFKIISFKILRSIRIVTSSITLTSFCEIDEEVRKNEVKKVKIMIFEQLESSVIKDAPEYIPVKEVADFFQVCTTSLTDFLEESEDGKERFGFIHSRDVNEFLKKKTGKRDHSLFLTKVKPHLMYRHAVPYLLGDYNGPNIDTYEDLYGKNESKKNI